MVRYYVLDRPCFPSRVTHPYVVHKPSKMKLLKYSEPWRNKFCLQYYATCLPKALPNVFQLSFSQSMRKNAASLLHNMLHVTYTNDAVAVEKWLRTHVSYRAKTATVIGFDVESVPSFIPPHKRNFEGIATVQLSTLHASLVVHLTRGQGQDGTDLIETASLCSSIQSVLHDPNIIKAGAGIDNDFLELQKWHPDIYRSCNCRFDIGGINFSSSYTRTSLANLARKILGVRLLKTKATTLSNWSRIPLTTSQINYAAYDAWAAVAILTILAKLDSSIFGANAIRQLLKDEPSIQDLHTPKRDNLKYFDISSLGGFQ